MDKNKIISLSLIVLSLILLAYPMIGTLYNNKRLDNLSHDYQEQISVEPLANNNEEALKEAEAYNSWLKNNMFTPPPIGHDFQHKDYAKYARTLTEPNNTMGIITVPDVNIRLPIYHGTTDEVLYKGAGHLYGTFLPVGGAGTTSVITAHSGMVDASMFDNLGQLQIGQKAYIQVRDRKLAYKMVSSEVVPPDSLDAIPFDDRDLLVLVTCTPYGVNTDRLVVVLERTALDDIAETSNEINTWQWWMTVIVSIVVPIIILLIFVTFRRNGKKNRSRLPSGR